jgi:spore coat polysaccharide biosynthesis protein SpsF (cytidylyltransferase family)
MNSSRLPGKVLMRAGSKSLLELQLTRVKKSNRIDDFILATTGSPVDDVIASVAAECGINFYRGSEQDVLDRFYQAAWENGNTDYVVRLTADCPLADPALIDSIIDHTIKCKFDYCSNTLDPGFPDGMDVECFSFEALNRAWREARLTSDREHVTPYIWRNSSFCNGTLFSSGSYNSPDKSYGGLRLTVDESADLNVITALVEALGDDATWQSYADYYRQHPEIQFNLAYSRNEGYAKSISQDQTH